MQSGDCDVTAALLGAPNTGKTTLFNTLTGRASRVTNWPGTTVDVEVAVIKHRGRRICLVDLPGTYGLSGSGPEERFARDFIVWRRPDTLIVLADSTNLARSLYLAIEAIEYHGRVIVVLSKIDEAEKRGIEIDTKKLEELLGAPVIPVSALQGRGLDELLDAIAEGRGSGGRIIADYGPLKECIERIASIITGRIGEPTVDPRVLALKLLEGVEWAYAMCREKCREAVEAAEECREELARMGIDPAAEAVAARYRAAEEIASRVVRGGRAGRAVTAIDRLLVNPYTGPPAALAILFTVFLAVFTVNTGFPLNIVADLMGAHWAAELLEKYSLAGLLAGFFDWLASMVKALLGGGPLAGLVADGVVAGVGLVVSFVPLIFMVFLLLGLLEDSGLLPRIAVGLDHVFRVFGVSGKAVFPALISLGCNVPGVMAARILDTREERAAVILATPFIPCQARLIVVLALASAAAATAMGQAVLVLEAYAIAIAVYLATILWLRRLVLRGEGPGGLVIEQPPLKKPSLRIAWWHAWSGLKHFLVRAGTVILVMSIVLWLLSHYGPAGPAATPAESYAAVIGRAVSPLIEAVWGVPPDKAWRIGLALLSGLAAKEVLLEALVMAAPLGPTASLRRALAWYGFTPQQWLGLMIASILYIPCAATIATIYAETRSWKMAAVSIVYSLLVATVVGGLVYRAAALIP